MSKAERGGAAGLGPHVKVFERGVRGGFAGMWNVERRMSNVEWEDQAGEWERRRRWWGDTARYPAEGGGEGCSASRHGETVNRTSSSRWTQAARRGPMSRSLRGGCGGMGFLPRKPSPRIPPL